MRVYYSCIPGDAIIFTDWHGPIDFIKGPGPLDENKISWSRLSCNDCVWIVPGTVQC